MKREFSAGGIVFKGNQVLLICNAALRDPSKSYWGFPKGHLDQGEKSPEAALREVEEETGIEAQLLDKIGDSKYVFTFEGEKIFKVVTMFLMEYRSGELKKQAEEVLEVRWVDPQEALKLLSFSKDREFLKKALEVKNGQ